MRASCHGAFWRLCGSYCTSLTGRLSPLCSTMGSLASSISSAKFHYINCSRHQFRIIQEASEYVRVSDNRTPGSTIINKLAKVELKLFFPPQWSPGPRRNLFYTTTSGLLLSENLFFLFCALWTLFQRARLTRVLHLHQEKPRDLPRCYTNLSNASSSTSVLGNHYVLRISNRLNYIPR